MPEQPNNTYIFNYKKHEEKANKILSNFDSLKYIPYETSSDGDDYYQLKYDETQINGILQEFRDNCILIILVLTD